MKFNKKGDLAISTNAIVILIIAVIMLGLLIGLATRSFKTVSAKFLEQTKSNEPEPTNPSVVTPITLSSGSKIGSAGDNIGIKVKVLNNVQQPGIGPLNQDLLGARPVVSCREQDADGLERVIAATESVTPIDIPWGAVQDFVYVFALQPQAPAGDYACVVKVVDYTGNEFSNQELRWAQLMVEVQ